MAGIVCRVCGEVWDSTGGLHYSHSDLTWWQYHELVHGLGCPCCGGVWPEHLDDTEATHFEEKWLQSVHYLSEGTMTEQEAREVPLWCFTGVWDDDGEPNPRVIPLFFIPPNGKADYPDPAWQWVGQKPEPCERMPASSPGYNATLRAHASAWLRTRRFPPGCLYVPREDSRARNYGYAIPHAPYFDNYFAGVALVPRYRDEHDEPKWHELCAFDGLRDKALELDVKPASELTFLGDDADDGLYVSVAERWIDNDEDADFVSRANYQAVEATLKEYHCEILYEGPELWARVGEYDYANARVRLNGNVIDTVYDIHGALENYPCLDDDLASRLEHEDQQKQITEWIEEHEIELEEASGLKIKTLTLLLDQLDREASAFYHDSGEFESDPKVERVIASIDEHLPPFLGWHPVDTPHETSIYVVPECPAFHAPFMAEALPGFLLWYDNKGEVHVDWGSKMPVSQLSITSYGSLGVLDWDSVDPSFRAAFRLALSSDGDYFNTDLE